MSVRRTQQSQTGGEGVEFRVWGLGTGGLEGEGGGVGKVRGLEAKGSGHLGLKAFRTIFRAF